MQVLLFDKNKKQREKVIGFLDGQDYELIETADRKELLDHLKEGKVQLVISDFEMKDGGTDLLNHILGIDLQKYPFMLFYTSRDAEARVIESLGPISGDFIVKPLKEAEFTARLMIAERIIALQSRIEMGMTQEDEMALYDTLTGMLNKQAAYERALVEHNRAQREGLSLCMAMIEVTNLNDIYEKHGQEICDQATRFVARAIRANVRLYDLVGRWIGAKFMVLLPGTGIKHAELVVNRIHKGVTSIKVTTPEGKELNLDVKAGYTISDKEAPIPLFMLIEQANDALIEVSQDKKAEVLSYLDLQKQ